MNVRRPKHQLMFRKTGISAGKVFDWHRRIPYIFIVFDGADEEAAQLAATLQGR